MRSNTAPYFFSNIKDKVYLSYDVLNTYYFPQVDDDENSPLKVIFDSGSSKFTKLIKGENTQTGYPQYGIAFTPTEEDVGKYYTRITLQEIESNFDSEFDLTVIVDKYNLQPSIKFINLEGEMFVEFNHQIVVPEDLSPYQPGAGIDIWVEGPLGSSKSGGSNPYNLGWRL